MIANDNVDLTTYNTIPNLLTHTLYDVVTTNPLSFKQYVNFPAKLKLM